MGCMDTPEKLGLKYMNLELLGDNNYERNPGY